MATELVSDTDLTVSTLLGASIRLQARTPRIVPEHLVQECLKQGARSTKDAKKTAPKATPVDKNQLVQAVAEILNSGDPGLLTNDGLPRMNEIKKRIGTSCSKDELVDAMAEVENLD